jgi:hypothetical protein
MGEQTPARYTDRPLPDYRHVPGRTPHPTRDPQGHSHGRPPAPVPDLNATDWSRCDEYLYGLDLFNAGYWWECHEVLENLWHAAGIGTPAGHALQAVIQCAAAHLKRECGQPVGASRLVDHAETHADWGGRLALGLDLRLLVAATRAHVAGGAPPVTLAVTRVAPPLWDKPLDP